MLCRLHTDGGQYLEEIEFVEDEAKRDPRLKAIVPMAPLEKGSGPSRSSPRWPTSIRCVRGIRRIVEFDADPRALTLSEGFIEGVNLLETFGMHLRDQRQPHADGHRPRVREAHPQRADDPRPLRQARHQAEGAIEQYRGRREGARRHPNLWIKLSDLPVEADHQHWTEDDLAPLSSTRRSRASASDRTIYAGDYPVCLQATTLPRWVEVLDRAFAELGLSESGTRKIYRDNANAFYRLGPVRQADAP